MRSSRRRVAAPGPTPKLDIDFTANPELGMMVPLQMRETFAAYTNFRRFGTGGRIVPQP